MLYASCKESVMENIEKKYGINFDKKVNVCLLFLCFVQISYLVGNL